MVKCCLITSKYLVTKIGLIFLFIISIGLTLAAIRLIDVSWYQSFISNNNYSDQLKPRTLVESASITLCVVIRIHSGHFPYLPVLALALSHTGFDKIHLYVISIDKRINNQLLRRTIDMINTIVRRTNYISILDVGVSEKNDSGFTLTDRALTYLYKQYEHSPSTCQYVIFTNGDNLYSQDLGNNVIKHMLAKKDIIAWDFISRYYRPHFVKMIKSQQQGSPDIFDAGTAKCLPVELRMGSADLGSAAYRLAFLKQYNLNFHYNNRTYDVLSDGFFIQAAASLANASVILRQTLYVHQ